MDLNTLAFYFLALLGVTGALGLVFSKKPVYAALNMALVMLTLGVHYVFLHASFLGAAQVLVYSGAVLILFLYISMLLDLKSDFHKKVSGAQRLLTYAVSIGLIALVTLAVSDGAKLPFNGVAEGFGDPANLGRVLITSHVIPFELASVLLIVAIIGSVMLGKRSLEA